MNTSFFRPFLQRHSFLQRYKAAITGIALSLAAVSGVAAPLPQDPATRIQARFDKIETSLTLTDEQTALWAAAETATINHMKTEFERRKTVHDTLRTTLAADDADLHALSETLLTDLDTSVSERKANHALWLALYDSLTDDQKTLARQALLEEMTKMERKRHMGPPPADAGHRRASRTAF